MQLSKCFGLDKYKEFVAHCKAQQIDEIEQLSQSDFVIFQKLSNCSDEFKYELIKIAREYKEKAIDDSEQDVSVEIREEPSADFPPFPYNRDTYMYDDIVSFEQLMSNYQFYCDNISALGDIPIVELNFSVRLTNVLLRAGFKQLKDILFLPVTHFENMRNFGRGCAIELLCKNNPVLLNEIIETLSKKESGITLDSNTKFLKKTEMSVRAFNVLNENCLLEEYMFLFLSDDQIRKLKNVGTKTAEELIKLKKNKSANNVGYFVLRVKEKLQDICAENYVFNIKFLVSERVNNALLSVGIKNIEELKNIDTESIKALWTVRDEIFSLVSSLNKSIIATLNEKFEWCLVSNGRGKNKEKEYERNIEILLNRARGLNLNEAGKEYSLTRERVRQIESKKLKKFDALLRKNNAHVFLDYLFKNSSYVFTEDIEKHFNHGEIFVYLLKKSEMDELVFIEELDAFIYGENWFVHVDQFIEQLPPTLTKQAFTTEVGQFFEYLRLQGIIFNQVDIEDIILSKFRVNGEYLTRSRLTLLAKYREVLERYFQYGISVYDDSDLDRFRNCYYEIYDDNEISDNNRALIGRIIDNCILIGRGRYGLKKDSYISNDLLNDIYNFIINNSRDIVMTNTVFHKFEKRLISEGVDNKYFLQGILKQHNTYGFFIKRDYISKTKEKSNIYNEIIDFIRCRQDIVNIAEITKEFPAIPDSVMSIVLSEEEIISVGNKNYIHRDNIEFDEQDEFYRVLKDLVAKEKLVSDNKIFALSNKKFADFMANNNINTPFFLYSILKSFFGDQFRFSRPHIIDESLDIIKGTDLIRKHFAGRESIKATEIKDFAREKDITIYSFIDLVNSLVEFLWADKETLINSSQVAIDENTLSKIEQVITNALGTSDYAEISKLNLINLLPPIGIGWTSWLIYAIIYHNSSNFVVAMSSNFYQLAVPLIMKNDVDMDYVKERIEEAQIAGIEYRIDDLSEIDKLVEGLVTEIDI